ncbi:GerAB/ArcD/ProY family transporter [Paenibacillus sp. LMG 31458]|uniref:GerAB/ArcD/ProY family transporter n=1 Tax=Paenibacillus phytorum TaxID=2654977 RepID=A0ABX1Y090_9BACL|nr:endospore germination permease [Paenibacillus phytorum]NOU74238.1 GerAB/ArcD/ProY family transporter [Paenibacillus phytorum]
MERISQSQLIMLLILIFYGPGIGFFITGISQGSGYAGWISLIAGWAGALALMFPILKVASSRPDEFITRFGGQLIGRWLHMLFMFIYLFYSMYIGAGIIRELSDFMTLVYLPLTPNWAIASLFGFSVILAVRSGIENIFRAASGLIFFVAVVVFLTPFLLGKELAWPMAGAFIRHWELQPIWVGSINTVGFFNMSMVLFIYPHLQNKEKTFRSLAIGSGCGVILVIFTYMICIMCFGVNLTAHLSYPMMEMFRTIRVGDFLDNMDPFFIGTSMSSLFIRVCIFLYITISGIGHMFGLKHSKPLAFSIGAVMIGMSNHIAENITEHQEFGKKALPVFHLLTELLLLLYLLGLWRHNRSPREHDPAEE